MEALFRIKAGEFDDNFINRVKSLLSARNDLEITISITGKASNEAKGILRQETKEEHFACLDESIKQLLNEPLIALFLTSLLSKI